MKQAGDKGGNNPADEFAGPLPTEPVPCDLCGSEDAEVVLEKAGGVYTRCLRCGFVFTNPRPTDECAFNASYFRATLDRYVTKSFDPRKQADYARRLRPFSKYRLNNRLLEIGSNVGGFLYQAREQGWRATGVEPVEDCARWGQERHGLDILPCTLHEAHLPENTFDVVYSNAVFEHLPSPSHVLCEIERVLRPGGVVYVDTVNYDSYTRRFIGAGWKLLNPAGHPSLFSPATLRRFCEKAGLTVIRIRTHGVRMRPHGSGRPRGLARIADSVRKFPLGLLARWTLKGDSIDVLALKPARG